MLIVYLYPTKRCQIPFSYSNLLPLFQNQNVFCYKYYQIKIPLKFVTYCKPIIVLQCSIINLYYWLLTVECKRTIYTKGWTKSISIYCLWKIHHHLFYHFALSSYPLYRYMIGDIYTYMMKKKTLIMKLPSHLQFLLILASLHVIQSQIIQDSCTTSSIENLNAQILFDVSSLSCSSVWSSEGFMLRVSHIIILMSLIYLFIL